MIDTDYEVHPGLAAALSADQDRRFSRSDVRSPTSTKSDVRSPTSTRTEVRSPTSTRTEVRSPTRTATEAYTQGNFTSTVTGGAGAGATYVTINVPDKKWKRLSAGSGKPVPEQSPWGFDVSKDALDASNSKNPFGFDISRDSSDGALHTGGSSYSNDLSFLGSSAGLTGFQAPLCNRDVLASLGNFKANLAGIDDVMNKDVSFDPIKTITLVTIKGGPIALAMAKKLAAVSAVLLNIANDRLKVVNAAREAYGRLKSQVDDLDQKTATLVAAKKTAEAEKVRSEAISKAKLAVQYQKVNALSTSLVDTATAQSILLKQMADAVASGKFYDLDALNIKYMQYADVAKKARDIRSKQLASMKEGLQGVKTFVDYFEENLNGLEGSAGRKKAKRAKSNFVFGGYTIETVGGNRQPVDNTMFKSVSEALAGAAIKTAITAKKVLKKPAPLQKKIVKVKKPVVKQRKIVPMNVAQIARQGTGAATAALVDGNVTGITPEQLTALTRQAQALVAGSTGSASSIIAQARQM